MAERFIDNEAIGSDSETDVDEPQQEEKKVISGSGEQGQRYRGWLVTVNNELWQPDRDFHHSIRWVRWQHERGENGTLHTQAAVYFNHLVSFKTAKERIGNNAHIEAAYDFDAVKKYVAKEKTRVAGPWERGEEPEKGKRTDLQKLHSAIKSGKSFRDLICDDELGPIAIRYPRGAQEAITATAVANLRDPPTILYIYGPPGVGKTKFLEWFTRDDIVRPLTLIINEYHANWPWDKYTGQSIICFDEFNSQIPISRMLSLLDTSPTHFQQRGRVTVCDATVFIICSNYSPQECYVDADQTQKEAWYRRIREYGEVYSVKSISQVGQLNNTLQNIGAYVIKRLNYQKERAEAITSQFADAQGTLEPELI